MDLSKYIEYVSKIFSSDGLSIGMAKITCEKSCELLISSVGDLALKISFTKNKPRVKIKFIAFSLSAIHLNDKGGVLEIDNFPDIAFTYDQIFK